MRSLYLPDRHQTVSRSSNEVSDRLTSEEREFVESWRGEMTRVLGASSSAPGTTLLMIIDRIAPKPDARTDRAKH
jgi:hypothetical protein